MGLDKNSTEYYHLVDPQTGMMLNKSDTDLGRHDSIERTLHAYLAYNDSSFIEALVGCIKIDNNKLQWYRYPTYYSNRVGISRDHLIYLLCAFKYAKRNENIKFLVNNTDWKLSEFASLTPLLWLWMKGLVNKNYLILFYPIMIIELLFGLLWDKVLRLLILDKGEYSQEDWDKSLKGPRKFKELSNVLFHTFIVKFVVFQIDVLPKSFGKWLTKQVLKLFVPRNNYLLQIMLGSRKAPTLEDIETYKPMSGDRWAQELNPLTNRLNTYILDKEEIGANELDKDLIRSMYNRLNKV